MPPAPAEVRGRVEVDGRAYEVVAASAAGAEGRARWRVLIDGEPFEAQLEPNGTGVVVRVADRSFHIEGAGGALRVDGRATQVHVLEASAAGKSGAGGNTGPVRVRPPMNGRLESLAVQPGQAVRKGDVLFVLEAMKMHNEVRSPADGVVQRIHVQPGAALEPAMTVLELG